MSLIIAAPAPRAHRRSRSSVEMTLRPPRYSVIDVASAASTPSASPRPTYDAPPLETSTSLDSASLRAERRPPRYSSVFDRPRGERERRHRTRAPGSPRGGGAASPQLHEYHLRHGGPKSAPYATLRVYSRASASPSGASVTAGASTASSLRVPKFSGADLVQGSLDLNLEQPTNINAISLSVRMRAAYCLPEYSAISYL